jgi:hypothetical protein
MRRPRRHRRLPLSGRLLSATAVALALAIAGCVAPKPAPVSAVEAAPATATLPAMDAVAEAYVKLVLAVGVHDPDYVDAYYGPAEWRAEAQATSTPLAELRARAEAQIAALGALPAPTEELARLRRRFLARQLAALASRIDLLAGAHMSFDEESEALYDAVAPTYDDAHFDALLARLDEALPGVGSGGSLTDRYATWQQAFVIPPDRLSRVFDAAIAECRRRTLEHVTLPAGESFTVGYVTGKPWGAYNWYQGSYHSLIQVNTDLPIYVDRAVDLACHEGYPGHHVYNALLEQHLLRERGWVEFEVYPLFSPESLIAEGSANFGIEVAFPGAERTAFERDVLFPLAGLDPARAEENARVRTLVEELSYAGNEAARRYLDGTIDAGAAAAWLERYSLMTPERAAQRVRFIDKYRSYVINYNLGEDLVRRWVEAQGGTADHPERRWQVFAELLSTPRLPSELAAETR